MLRDKKEEEALKRSEGEIWAYPLSDAELGFLTGERPEMVFIGTGQYGDLPVTPAAAAILERHQAVIRPTPDILVLIELEKRKFVAVLHTTC